MYTDHFDFTDPDLEALVRLEEDHQRDTLSLVASESLLSPDLYRILGSAFASRTAVGLPGHQRMGGCDTADRVEMLACERACTLFGAEHANVLPVSASTAMLSVMTGLLEPSDPVLALDPAVGSHTTHGAPGHITSRLCRPAFFGLDRETMRIDYDEMERMARTIRPKMLILGISAYSRDLDYARAAAAAHENGAYLCVDMAHTGGLIAAGLQADPVPYADVIVGSGTKTLCGPHCGFILCRQALADAVDRGTYPGMFSSVHLQSIAALAWQLRQCRGIVFRELMQRTVNCARALSDALISLGVPVLTGGTDNHMLIADIGCDAAAAAARLERAGIIVSTKKLPYDLDAQGRPLTRGLRLGTTVCAQRGMQPQDMIPLARRIVQTIRAE